MRLKGLAPLLFSFILGCSSSGMLKGGIHVNYRDENCHYVYLPIGDTKYYVKGEDFYKYYAKRDAEERLKVINEYCMPTLGDLREADKLGEMELIIEDEEYEALIAIRFWKKVTDEITNVDK